MTAVAMYSPDWDPALPEVAAVQFVARDVAACSLKGWVECQIQGQGEAAGSMAAQPLGVLVRTWATGVALTASQAVSVRVDCPA